MMHNYTDARTTSYSPSIPPDTNRKTTEIENIKDRPFTGFRIAATTKAQHIVTEATNLILAYERHRAPRKRARQTEHRKTFDRQVEALVCDLIHRQLTRPDAWLSISLSDSNLGRVDRYRPIAISKKLKEVLKFMTSPEMEMAEHRMGFRSPFNPGLSVQSTIRAGARLRSRIDEHGLTTDDFKLDHCQEVIILKDMKEDLWDKGKWLQYPDTDETRRYRDELRYINDGIARACIEYLPLPSLERPVDTANRRLRRYFNNSSFEQGGRLFGGFWQRLSKDQRQDIVIDGTSTVTLDYGQMVPRVLYGLAGVEPEFDDAYVLPGLEDYRDGVKMVFNSMLHSRRPLTRKPQGSTKLLPKWMNIEPITEKIIRFHEPVAHVFYAGKGLYLSFKESTVLVKVLTTLLDQGIVALPIHDAIIVREDHQAKARLVMLEVFREVTGIDGVVNLE